MYFGWSCPLVITIASTAVIFAKESDFSCRRFPLLVPLSQDVITSAHFPYLRFDYISNLLRAVPLACCSSGFSVAYYPSLRTVPSSPRQLS